MAEQNLSAPARAYSRVRRSVGGVSHVKEYQPKRYTIVGNHLTQHRELSLTAIGLGAHIQSLPHGAPVDIRTLAARFPEGRDRIAEALRELEAHGYIARRRERTPQGRIVTRTVSYNAPEATRVRLAARQAVPQHPTPLAAPASVPPAPPELRPARPPRPEPTTPAPDQAPDPAPDPAPEPATTPATEEHRAAAALLANLRRHDDRLLLTERDVRRLAPAVATWLERGAAPDAVRRTLTANLPPDLRHPAGLLAHRLTELLPPPLPAAPARSRPAPLQNCDGCDRAFRAPTPGLCGDCRETDASTTTPLAHAAA